MYTHPLLAKIDISSTKNIDDAFQKIAELGLNVKKYNNLIIVKYPKSLKYSEDNYIRQSRGIIINYDTKSIVNHSIEGDISIDQFIKQIPDWNDIVVEECLDGTLLNLYYINNSWKLSTKFSVNADESIFRGNKTYRQLFDEVSRINYDNLDKNYTYSFLLQHNEARNVSVITRNKIYHLESTNNVTGDKVKIDIPTTLSSKVLYYNNYVNTLLVNNIDELRDKVTKLSWSVPGYMLYSKDRKYRCKIENPHFQQVLELTKNQSNIRYILLEALYVKKNIKDILKYYPEYMSKTVEISDEMYDYTYKLHQIYITSKVHHKFIQIDNKFKKALCDLHSLYKSKRESGNKKFKITYNEVCKLVHSYDTAYMYSIVCK